MREVTTKGSLLSQPEDLLDREARAARNQSLFRDVNERVRTLEAGLSVHVSEWFCECANESCFEQVTMSHQAYEAIREHGNRFLVAPNEDHLVPDVECLIAQNERYWIVEKTGDAERIARRFDPRSRALPLKARE